jgi:hypothetical protein
MTDDLLPFPQCIECGEPFTHANVHTALGWRETQLSGYCEDCFDLIFGEDDEQS